jgi:hypothetical protein
MAYQIKITQNNKEGKVVFEYAPERILTENEDDILVFIAQFLTETFLLNKKIKNLFGTINWMKNIRTSYPINLTIIDLKNEIEANLKLQNYKHLILHKDKKGLFKQIKAELGSFKEQSFFNEISAMRNCIDIELKGSTEIINNFSTLATVRTETKLTNFEAFSICRGLTDNSLKKLSRDFFEGKKISNEHIIKAHSIANEAIQKYGKEHIEFLIQLPMMPFKAENIKLLYCEIERNRILNNRPEVTITLKNKELREDIQISYFSSKSRNLIKVRTKGSSKDICLIDKEGIIVPGNNNKGILPVLRLLLKTSDEISEKILYYGHTTGNCYICGRKLTDLESVQIGLGPICRQFVF